MTLACPEPRTGGGRVKLKRGCLIVALEFRVLSKKCSHKL